MNYIYGLLCPVSNVIRYVGKSDDPYRRLREHMESCERNSHHAARWLAGLKRKSVRPAVVVLAEIDDNEDWQQVERHFIASGKALGWKLTNSTPGGEGGGWLHADDKAAWIEKVSESVRAPEVRERISRGVSKAYENPCVRDRAANRQRLRWKDPAYRAQVSALMSDAMSTPENKKKTSERGKSLMAMPGARAAVSQKMKAYCATDQGKRARSQIASDPAFREARRMDQARNWSDPAYRERLMSAKTSPEVIDKQKKKAKSQWADPEIRARMLAAMAASRIRRKADAMSGLYQSTSETSPDSV